MARLKTMTTQFIDGAPNGVRICRCTLSTMTTVFVPRPLLSRAKQVNDLPLRGIYYLINDEDGAISRLYVGQTTQGIIRLDDHNAKKDFWNKAILFLSDDIQAFSLDNVSALEKYAIEQARASKRYTVENKVDPRYKIDQYQKPTVEQIYEEIAFIMGTFGYQIEDTEDAIADTKLFFTSRRGVRARGVYTGETFDVLEGSPVDLNVQPKLARYEKMRQELLDSGHLVREADGMGRLGRTVSFSTPSGAADFVLGGSNNGWVEWKDADHQTLDTLYRK
ncbi:MAG: GIY-YIG nuclease family protein [Olegusella sp.]|nr:GIY-YIG nuclease family protein [Olegusella sp.]